MRFSNGFPLELGLLFWWWRWGRWLLCQEITIELGSPCCQSYSTDLFIWLFFYPQFTQLEAVLINLRLDVGTGRKECSLCLESSSCFSPHLAHGLHLSIQLSFPFDACSMRLKGRQSYQRDRSSSFQGFGATLPIANGTP